MIYTLNLFDILPEKAHLYRQYSREAGRVILGLGGRVICSGWHDTTLRGEETRAHFIVVEFPTQEAFELFLGSPEHRDMHQLREDSTVNYIWKVFEPWNLEYWVAFAGMQ